MSPLDKTPSRCCSRSYCIRSRSCGDSCCCCNKCDARPDHLSKWAELCLSRYLQIVWRGLRIKSCETAFEVTTKQPYPVLDRLRWNKPRWCNFLLFPVPDRN